MSRTIITTTERPSDGWATIRRVVPYLWPADHPWIKRRVVLALIVLVLAKVVSVITPFFYKAAVDMLSGESRDAAWLLALGTIGLTAAYGMARLMSIGFNQLRDAIFARVGQRALRVLALTTFRHIHRLSMHYHISRKTGGLSRIMERGVKGVEFLLRFMLFSIGPLIIELLMVGGIMWAVFDFRYLLVVMGVIIAYVAYTFSVTEWRLKLRKQMNDQDTDANQKAIDSLLNFETVKYFGAEEREAMRYDRAMAGYAAAAVRSTYSLGILNFGQAFLINLGLVVVMVMAALDVQKGTLTVGDYVMVNAYIIQIVAPLNFLGTVYREIRQALVDMGAMFGLLEQQPGITDSPDARPLKVTGGTVVFDDVRFGYDDKRTILKGVSLTVPAGQTVAIVGPSGSGKSTIGRLLFRFYDVSGGEVRIDGQDVRDVTQTSLHDAIGVVPQDTVLFNDTIRYNIGYGREGASESDIIRVARAAQIHDFIMSLPDGYNTTVGERGLKLSGGEKQRVGIARTLLKNPPILLLDEATSALDTETERGIQGALAAAAEGRTVITIAHRLSTIADADQIIVLQEGEIVETGTHTDLLDRQGRYWQLWQQQASERQSAQGAAAE